MQVFNGIPAAPGIAIGPGFHHKPARYAPARGCITDAKTEIERLDDAIERSAMELKEIYEEARKTVGEETAQIFCAHMMMLKDPDLLDGVKQKINTERVNAEAAFHDASESYADLLQNLSNENLQARAVDVRDVSARVIQNLRNEAVDVSFLSVPSIVFAEDLSPSETVHFEREKLLGLCTVKGGTVSHTAILSGALGIPALVGVAGIRDFSFGGHTFILDGFNGCLIVDPDESTVSQYLKLQNIQRAKLVDERTAALGPAVTLYGKNV